MLDIVADKEKSKGFEGQRNIVKRRKYHWLPWGLSPNNRKDFFLNVGHNYTNRERLSANNIMKPVKKVDKKETDKCSCI